MDSTDATRDDTGTYPHKRPGINYPRCKQCGNNPVLLGEVGKLDGLCYQCKSEKLGIAPHSPNKLRELAYAIKRAVGSGDTIRIAVHNKIQAELGTNAAKRLGGDLSKIIFELIPERERDIYYVGAVLV